MWAWSSLGAVAPEGYFQCGPRAEPVEIAHRSCSSMTARRRLLTWYPLLRETLPHAQPSQHGCWVFSLFWQVYRCLCPSLFTFDVIIEVTSPPPPPPLLTRGTLPEATVLAHLCLWLHLLDFLSHQRRIASDVILQGTTYYV